MFISRFTSQSIINLSITTENIKFNSVALEQSSQLDNQKKPLSKLKSIMFVKETVCPYVILAMNI